MFFQGTQLTLGRGPDGMKRSQILLLVKLCQMDGIEAEFIIGVAGWSPFLVCGLGFTALYYSTSNVQTNACLQTHAQRLYNKGTVKSCPSMQRLPTEILLRIIESTANDSVIAYPACHVVTRTLNSWISVSKSVTKVASRELRRHCLYIDRSWHLSSLLGLILTRNREGSTHLGPLSMPVEKLYLSPFSSNDLNEPSVVADISRLFILIGPSLQRLVIDMPLRSHYPEDDVNTQLRPILRNAFQHLTSVQDFVSVKDELYLQTEMEGLERMV